jgi:hypothetical protein
MMSVMTMQAQKIDQRLTALVLQSTTRHHAQDKAINRKAVTDRIGVKLNDNGTICSMSASVSTSRRRGLSSTRGASI